MALRLILNGFYNTPFQTSLRCLLSHDKVEFLATLDQGATLLPSKIETIHHDFDRCLRGDFPVPMSSLLPLDDAFVREMAPLEQVIMRMMDRLHPVQYREFPDRKFIYLRQLRYWNDFLIRHRITNFCSTNIPHEISDYIIYYLCQHYGIPCALFEMTALCDRFGLFQTIEKRFDNVHTAFQEVINKNLPPQVEAENLQIHIKKMMEKTKTQPFYMAGNYKELRDKHSAVYWAGRAIKHLKSALNGDFVRRILQARDMFLFARRDKELFRYYENLINPAGKPEGRYVFVPLHFQPEMTTCPLAKSYVDQQLIIGILDAVLPKDVTIAVKEHPFQRSQGRVTKFYDELVSYNRVQILPKNFPSHQLIEGAAAVATCTGTAGWESLWFLKPVLLFGEIFYCHAPGVYDARTVESCKSAVNEIFSHSPPSWKCDDLARYVEAVEKSTHAGYCDAAYTSQSSISPGDNAENICKILFKKLGIEKYA